MSVDFAALTAAVGAGLIEVRACLIVSRDGLALGSYPPGEEAGAMERWMRLASLGDVERGFAVVGEECWVFCTRGPYSALAVAKASVRPGLILERLDQMALAAEEGRLRKDALAPSGLRDEAAARRRRPTAPPTGIHPATSPQPPLRPERLDLRSAGASDVVQGTAAASAVPSMQAPPTVAPPAGARPSVPPDPVDREAHPSPRQSPAEHEEGEQAPGERTLWVMDANALTREFAALLEDPDDEGGL